MRNAVGNEANTVWNPVEEHVENGVIKGLMHENFKNGIFNKVPMLIGSNSEEELQFGKKDVYSFKFSQLCRQQLLRITNSNIKMV